MARRSRKLKTDTLAFRLAENYLDKVREYASDAGISDNQFGRVATMVVAQNGLLILLEDVREMRKEIKMMREEIKVIRDVWIELKQFRNDFAEALVSDDS